jgi:hypothetical protein
MKVLSNQNFQKKAQLVELVIHKVATTLPTSWAGGLIYVESGANQGLWYGGASSWVKVGDNADIFSISPGDGISITGTANAKTISARPDDVTLENSGEKIQIREVPYGKLKTSDVETTLVGAANKIASASAILTAINAVNSEIPSVAGIAPVTAIYNPSTKTYSVSISDNAIGLAKLNQIGKNKLLGRGDQGAANANVDLVDMDTAVAEKTNHDSVPSTKAVKSALDTVAGQIPTYTGGDGIDITGTVVKVDLTGSTLDISSNKLRVANSGITAGQLATDAVETAKIKAKNVTFAKIEDISANNVLGNLGLGNTNIAIDNTVPTTEPANHNSIASTKAIHAYVASKVTALGQPQGGYNATTNSAFPGGTIVKGDYWWITHPGSLGTAPNAANLDTGDVIIANKNSPSTSSKLDWVILETNREEATTDKYGWVRLASQANAQGFSVTDRVLTPANLSDIKASDAEAQGSGDDRFVTPKGLHNRTATTSRRGIAELATQAEVDTGTDTTRIVTPATLKSVTNAIIGSIPNVQRVWVNVPSGANPTVNHNLNATNWNVSVQLFRKLSGDAKELVQAGINLSSKDSCTINFADASLNPAAGTYVLCATLL